MCLTWWRDWLRRQAQREEYVPCGVVDPMDYVTVEQVNVIVDDLEDSLGLSDFY